MNKTWRIAAVTALAAMTLSVFVAAPAEAGSKGRRNTAIGLGAVAIYGIVKKKPVVAGLAGGGAIYSYVRSRQAARRERNRRHYRRHRAPYCARHRRYHRHYH